MEGIEHPIARWIPKAIYLAIWSIADQNARDGASKYLGLASQDECEHSATDLMKML